MQQRTVASCRILIRWRLTVTLPARKVAARRSGKPSQAFEAGEEMRKLGLLAMVAGRLLGDSRLGAPRRVTPALGVVLAALTWAPGPADAASGCRHHADGRDSDWVGTPSYVSGTSVYSGGEYIYSDYVHNDYGANVDGLTSNNPDPPQPVTGVYPNPQNPTSPYIGGAADSGDRFQHTGDYGYPSSPSSPTAYEDVADTLEFREALDCGQLHFLVRLGDMTSPDSTAIGIGIDADRNAATGAGSWPLGANLNEQLGYEYFITLWGTGGQITDYTKSPAVTMPVHVVANTTGRPPFIEADVPLPSGAKLGAWRTYVGSGLWNASAAAWQTPLPAPSQSAAPGSLGAYPAIYNLLFTPHEPNDWWRDTTQANDLASRDIAEDHADINTGMLARRAGSPRPRLTGLLNVQYRTLPLGSGEGVESGPNSWIYDGPIQPYSLVVPSNYYTKPHPRRFMFFYHCAFCNQNIWAVGVEAGATAGHNNLADGPMGTQQIQSIVDRSDMLVAGSLQRGLEGPGSYGDIPGPGERDLRDVYDTIRGRDRYSIDPNKVMYSGMSMGGLTTQTMMTLYPDELASAISYDGCPLSNTTPLIARMANVRDVPFYEINGDTGLDSTCSSLGRMAAQQLDTLGYREMYIEYLGRAHDFNLVYDSLPIIQATAYRQVRDPNPARVTFERDAAMEDPKLGLVHDHSYWASNLKLAPGASSGTIDATALPLAYKLPKLISHLTGTFLNTQTGSNAYLDWQAWDHNLINHGLQDFQSGWTPGPDVTVINTKVAAPAHAGENAFDLTTTGLSATDLDLDRMHVALDRTVTGYLSTDTPLTLKLCAKTVAMPALHTLDGTSVPSPLSGSCIVVQIPSGTHTLVLHK
jgi:hypothetical protein